MTNRELEDMAWNMHLHDYESGPSMWDDGCFILPDEGWDIEWWVLSRELKLDNTPNYIVKDGRIVGFEPRP